MAASFRHVLGVEAEPQLVLAAKELQEKGALAFAARRPRRGPGSGSGGGADEGIGEGGGGNGGGGAAWEEVHAEAKVPDDIDRDRVRFWHVPGLPDLPPKLAPVDAVAVEDGAGRLAGGRARLLAQLPGALNARGVCVVALPAGGGAGGAGGDGGVSAAEEAKALMGEMRMELVHEERWPPAAAAAGSGGGGSGGAAVLLVWRKPGF